MKPDIGNDIQNREEANDIFMTPSILARKLINQVPLAPRDVVCDAFAGTAYRPFYDNYPLDIRKHWMEIREGKDAFACTDYWDWIVTNPPFSNINRVLEYSTWSCRKGFAYILPNHGLSYRRIKMCEDRGFKICKLVSFPNPDNWTSNGIKMGFSHMFVIWRKRPGKVRGVLETVDYDNDLQTILEDFL